MGDNSWLHTCVAAAGLCAAIPAMAADKTTAADTPAVSQSADAGDIIVTARKRNESILKVPVVETVVSGVQLQEKQITDLSDLSASVPGLNIGSAVLSIGPQISLRGIGTSSLDSGIDQSVSLNIDGLSLSQGLAYSVGVFDLAQVEVLKGPQALFFGKNSPGGVISLRSNDPGDHVEVIGRFGYEGEANEKRAELIYSTPVTDTFGIRIAGLGDWTGGFFHNKATPDIALGAEAPNYNYTPDTSYIVRGTALWKPASNFTARLKANYSYDKATGGAADGQLTSCTQGTGPGSGGVQFIAPNDDCKLNRDIYTVYMNPADYPKISNGGVPFSTLKQKFGTLDLNYSTGNHINVTSVTGFYRADSASLINSTLTGYAPPAYAAENNFHRRDITQEFRADTNFSGPLNFTAGAFYQDGQIYNLISLPINTLLVPSSYFPTGYLIRGSHQIDIQSYSAFGQIRYKIIPKLEITAGVRWTDEKRKDTPYNLNTADGTPQFVTLAVPKIHSSRFSPEATITYTPTNDLTLFTSAKQGYKSGSFSITVPATNGQDISFGDERIRGVEAGLKSRLLDRQLSLNVAGYFYKYTGLQVGVNAIADSLPIEQTINAGGAKIYGIDFDMSFRPQDAPGLTFNAAINYNHARFTELKDAPCYGNQTASEGCNALLGGDGLYHAQDLSGIPLVRAPLWTLNGGFNYDIAIGVTYKVNFGMDAQYTTSYLRGLSRRPDYVQPAYGQLDGNVAFGPTNDRWQLSLVGRNLTDKITAGSCTDLNSADGEFFQGGQITGSPTNARGPDGINSLTCVARRGRELWVRVSAKY